MEHKNLVYSLKVASEQLYNFEEAPFALEYYIVQSKDKGEDSLVYGVEIKKLVDGKVAEEASEYRVGRTFERAKHLLDVLAHHTVTPTGLLDIMEEVEF